jgi:hypothetical protein
VELLSRPSARRFRQPCHLKQKNREDQGQKPPGHGVPKGFVAGGRFRNETRANRGASAFRVVFPDVIQPRAESGRLRKAMLWRPAICSSAWLGFKLEARVLPRSRPRSWEQGTLAPAKSKHHSVERPPPTRPLATLTKNVVSVCAKRHPMAAWILWSKAVKWTAFPIWSSDLIC